MSRIETSGRNLPELRLVKPDWRIGFRQEIAFRSGDIRSGRQGYQVRKEIIDRVWREPLSIKQLRERRREAREFISSATTDSEKLLGRSLLGRIDYHLRKEICLSGALGEFTKELRGAAQVFSATRGVKLENFDYDALSGKIALLRALEPVEIENLEPLLAKDSQAREKSLRARVAFLGIDLSRINIPPVVKDRVAVLVALSVLTLAGWGFLIANRFFRHVPSLVQEKPKTEITVPPVEPPAGQPELVIPPVKPTFPRPKNQAGGAIPTETPIAFDGGVEAGFSPSNFSVSQPNKEAFQIAKKRAEILMFSAKADKKTGANLDIKIGGNVFFGGEVFDNRFFEQKAVLPGKDGKFNSNEMAIGAYSFDNKERTAIWAIHSGFINGQPLPGQVLLDNLNEIGKKMVISSGNNFAQAEYVGSFVMAKENYSFSEESIVCEAAKNGYDLWAKKYLAVITCDKWDLTSESYDEVKVLLFLPC